MKETLAVIIMFVLFFSAALYGFNKTENNWCNNAKNNNYDFTEKMREICKN